MFFYGIRISKKQTASPRGSVLLLRRREFLANR